MLTIISYLDRQAMSLVAPSLVTQFHLSNTDVATIVNAFLAAYMVGQVLAGRFLDWIGAKLGLAFLVTGWSIASALTSLGTGVVSFSAFRSALGLAEGVNFPGGVKVISEWFDPHERATAIGVFTSGASIGAIVAPPLFSSIISSLGWQATFLLTGVPGLLWVAAWLRIYPKMLDRPHTDRIIGRENSAPWSQLLRHRAIWGILLARFVEEPVSWFYLTWLPLYMHSDRGTSISTIGIALIFPFAALDIGYLAGGWISSRLIRAGLPLDQARKRTMLVSALCMVSGIPAATAGSTTEFVAWVSLAMLGHGAWGANVFTLPSDVTPTRWVGSAYGLTAFGGSLGAILFTQAVGRISDAQQSFRNVFLLAGVLPLLAALVLWTVPGRIRPMMARNI